MRRVADPPGKPVGDFRFGRAAAFKSESWPASFRNSHYHCAVKRRLASPKCSLYVHIAPRSKRFFQTSHYDGT
jgi:hypothetical protein